MDDMECKGVHFCTGLQSCDGFDLITRSGSAFHEGHVHAFQLLSNEDILRFHIEPRGHASPQAFFACILVLLIDKSGFLGSLVGISSPYSTVPSRKETS